MRSDKGQLIAAREKTKKNQGIGWIAESPAQHLSHALFQLGPGHGLGRAHQRQGQKRGDNQHRKDHEDPLPGHHRQKKLGHGRADHLTGGPGSGGNRQRHRPVVVRRGPADHGQDHAKPGPRNAETDGDFEKLML